MSERLAGPPDHEYASEDYEHESNDESDDNTMDEYYWQQRAIDAEAERDALRGEVVALREALVEAGREFTGMTACTKCAILSHFCCEKAAEDFWKAIDRIDKALTATPRATQLGALVEAALAWHKTLVYWVEHAGDSDEVFRQVDRALEDRRLELCIAADAVLASEVRTG